MMKTANLDELLATLMERTPTRPRVDVTVHNRLFPPAYRKPEVKPELPEAFRSLPEALVNALPFKAATAGGLSKEQLFDAYNQGLEQLDRKCEKLQKLVASVLVCGIEVRENWMNNERKFAAMKAKYASFQGKLPSMSFERPRLVAMELFKQQQTAIATQLYFAQVDAAHSLVKAFVAALDALVNLELVGLIEWVCEDGCRYHFFRNVLMSEGGAAGTTVEDVGRVTRTTTKREVETTHRHARHMHELIAAKNYYAASAGHVARPGRVDALLSMVPDFLMPYMRIVTGKQTAKVVIERDLSVEKTTEADVSEVVKAEAVYRPDPALVCGFYVLAGWDDETEDKTPAQQFQQVLNTK